MQVKKDRICLSSPGERVTIPNSHDNDNTYSVIIQYDGFEIPEVPNYTALSSITIDGEEYADFDAKVFDMTLPIDANAAEKPVVTAQAAFEDAEVKVTDPETFPGKTVIEVTMRGEETSVYTINWAIEGGLVSDFAINPDYATIEYDNGGTTTTATTPLPVWIDELKVGSKAYADRDFLVEEVNGEEYLGKPYLAMPLHWANAAPWREQGYTGPVIKDWFSFKLNRDATVRIVSNAYSADKRNDGALLEMGYTYKQISNSAPITVNITSNDTHPQYKYESTRTFAAGSTVNIPNLWGGQVFFVVLDFAEYGEELEITPEPTPTPDPEPEPDPEPVATTALKSVKVDGVDLAGFNKATLTYDALIAADASDFPVVTAEAETEGANVQITNPSTFPGNTVITVSLDGVEDTQYVINWSAEGGLVSDFAISPDYATITYNNGTKDVTATTPLPVWIDELKVGSKAYSDRDFLVEEVNGEEYIGKPYLAMPLHWANAAPWREMMFKTDAEIIDDWFSFKLNRDATVRIINSSSKTGEALTKKGYTYKYYSDLVPATVNITANNTHPAYKHEYVRTFAAGSTVNIPNLYGGQVFFVVFDFAEYGEEKEITPEPVPVVTSALQSVTIDGVSLDGFDKATLIYEAIVDPLAYEAPEVVAVAETEGAEVTVTNATTFPGKTVITVSCDGVEDTEYVINWKTEENLISDITILQDNTIPEIYGGGAVSVMPGYLPGGFQIGAVAYVDRANRVAPTYRVKATADESLIGCDYITGAIGWYNGDTPTIKAFKSDVCMPWINFTVARGATVNVLMYRNTHEQRFKDYGYELTVNSNTEVGYLLTELNSGKQKPHIYKFSKHFNAGERVSIPNALDNDNTYCAVIVYDDYGVEQEAADISTTLKSISVDGANVATFTSGQKEYTLTIDVAATAAPVVEAVTSDEDATYFVTNPDTFPGQTVITVSKDGCEDTEYIITWQTSVSLVSDMAISPDYAKYTYNNGTKDVTATAPLPVYMESLEVGSKAFSDRDFVTEEVNGVEYLGKPYLAMPLSWQNAAPWRDGVYNGVYIADWLTFTVNRKATVRVLKDSYSTSETHHDIRLVNDYGFTHKKYTEYKPVVVNITTNNTHPDYIDELSKTVEAGETVTIPNIHGGQVYFVVFDFEGYTE